MKPNLVLTFESYFCVFFLQDLVSAPRPPSPPVWRHAHTENEKENSRENGLPSSHTINTLSLSLSAPHLPPFPLHQILTVRLFILVDSIINNVRDLLN